MEREGFSYFWLSFVIFLLLVGVIGLGVYYSEYYEGGSSEGKKGSSIVCDVKINISSCDVDSAGIAKINLKNNDVSMNFSEVLFDFLNNGNNVFLKKYDVVLEEGSSKTFTLSNYRINYPTLVRVSLNFSDGYYCIVPGFIQCGENDGENDPENTYICDDGLDNDEDGFIDEKDADCHDSLGNYDKYLEEIGGAKGQCSDGKDNNNNTLIDWSDPYCYQNSIYKPGNDEALSLLSSCSDGLDNDEDGLTDEGDYGCISSDDSDEKGIWKFTKPKRLLHFQLVGGSADLSDRGNINPNVWSDSIGWNAAINNFIEPVRAEIGDDAFDIAMWQIGGGWPKYAVWLPGDGEESSSYSGFLFEALTIAERDISPSITDYTVLRNYVNTHDMNMIAYIGMPRCQTNNEDEGRYIPVPEHCYPDNFDYYQGELMDGSFIGVGYDYSAGHMSNDSKAYPVNLAIMRDLGVEPYIEAVPPRDHPWNLGYSVWADENRWNFTENDPQNRFYKESEINAAGGITIHGVRNPPEGVCEVDDEICENQWRWDKSVELLKQGKYVNVNLNWLREYGYNLSCLAELSKGKVQNCA